MRPRLLMGFLITCLAAGCGGGGGEGGGAPPGSTVASLSVGPHGAPAVALPGGAGLAEVMAEMVPSATDPVLAVYFLKPDGATPLSPLPTDARVVIDGTDHPLTAKGPAKKDAAGAGRMVTGPLPIDPDRVSGELAATINGEGVRVPFVIGQ